MRSNYKVVFIVALISIMMMQIGCASAAKKKASKTKESDCPDCHDHTKSIKELRKKMQNK